MKLLLGLLPLLLVAGAVANQAPETTEVAPFEREDGIMELEPVPANDRENLQHAKNALDAVQKFVDIFNAEYFKGPVKIAAELLSKCLSFVSAILNLIMGTLDKPESPEIKFMREQFKVVNAKLDGISLKLDEVKKLIEWTTTRKMYSDFEIFLVATSHLFDNYVAANSKEEREIRQRMFITAFEPKRLAALKLYQAIVESDFVVADNIAAAVVQYTENHRRNIRNFLLAMNRLILRGSQLEIAYEKLKHGDAAAKVTETDWARRMEKLVTKIRQVDEQVERGWHEQMKRDFEKVISANQQVNNGDFSGIMYNFLADKYDWRIWFSLAYGSVSGFHLHAISTCDGHHRFRVAGDRNVAVASADPETSRFTTVDGDQALAEADSAGHGTTNAEVWWHEVDRRVAGGCDKAAFRGTICWGCNVWWTAPHDSFSYRKINPPGGGSVNTILFG